jgi:hypothetical protein
VSSSNRSGITSLKCGIFKHAAVRIANLAYSKFSHMSVPFPFSPCGGPIPHPMRLANVSKFITSETY